MRSAYPDAQAMILDMAVHLLVRWISQEVRAVEAKHATP
jgi:hypothetical protein